MYLPPPVKAGEGLVVYLLRANFFEEFFDIGTH